MFTKRSSDASPRLLADVGGTNVRLALQIGPGRIDHLCVMPTAAHASLLDAVRSYLDGQGERGQAVCYGAVGIANPVLGDTVRMTNHDWAFSSEAMRAALGWQGLHVINDFAALAYALPQLPAAALRQIGPGTACVNAPRVLIGPGTGLGVSSLVMAHGRPLAVPGEGGHIHFAPADELELQLWQTLHKKYGHISAERLLSGSGLSIIYDFLMTNRGESGPMLAPEQIIADGLAGKDQVSVQTINLFCALLGTVAADIALVLGALGGVYIGGGIVPRFGAAFAASPFRQRFEDKGRFASYLATIPTYVIDAPQPALLGLAAALDAELGQHPGVDVSDVLNCCR
jgi:glucokinase